MTEAPDLPPRPARLTTVVGAVAYAALPASLALHFVVMLCFTFRWDKAAALTIVPFTVWAAAGLGLALASWLVLRWRHATAVAIIWIVSAAYCADEARGLLNVLADKPGPGTVEPFAGVRPLRVITINCGDFVDRTGAAAEIEAFNPDVVLFQEAPHLRFLNDMTERLFAGQGTFVYDFDCAIAARGRLIKTSRGRRSPWLQATLTFPGGGQIELLNVHLDQAVTDLRLWRKSTWKHHYYNRKARRRQLASAVSHLLRTAGARPSIVAGDFNAPASDAVYRLLEPHFADTYKRAGSGWPNTFSNALPLLRIDQIWTTPELTPVRHTAVRSSHSDHRFVVCDLLVQTTPNNRPPATSPPR